MGCGRSLSALDQICRYDAGQLKVLWRHSWQEFALEDEKVLNFEFPCQFLILAPGQRFKLTLPPRSSEAGKSEVWGEGSALRGKTQLLHLILNVKGERFEPGRWLNACPKHAGPASIREESESPDQNMASLEAFELIQPPSYFVHLSVRYLA